MKQVTTCWGVLVFCKDGRQFFACHDTALAIWHDRKKAYDWTKELRKHIDGRAKVVRLTVTAELADTMREKQGVKS